MLLEEIIKYDKDGNYDRVIAAELAIALANKLNPIIKVSSLEEDNRTKSYFDRHSRDSKTFSIQRSVLSSFTRRSSTKRRNRIF